MENDLNRLAVSNSNSHLEDLGSILEYRDSPLNDSRRIESNNLAFSN